MNITKLERKKKKQQKRNQRQADYRQKRQNKETEIVVMSPDVSNTILVEWAKQLGDGLPVDIYITPEHGAMYQACFDNCCMFQRHDENVIGGYKVVVNRKGKTALWLTAEPHFVLFGERYRDPTPDFHISRCVFVPSSNVTPPTVVGTITNPIFKVLVDDPRVHQAIAILEEGYEWQWDMMVHHDPNAIRQYNAIVERAQRLLRSI